MKVGDLVKPTTEWLDIYPNPVLPTLGLVISIQHHNYGPRLSRVRVRWPKGSLSEYCYMSNLEIVSEGR